MIVGGVVGFVVGFCMVAVGAIAIIQHRISNNNS